MLNFQRIPLLLALLCFLLTFPYYAAADYDAGLKAYSARDFHNAFLAFEESANQGDTKAQYALGMLYYQGNGVEKNLGTAYKWFTKAEAGGHATAGRMVELLKPQITPTDLAEAPSSATPIPQTSVQENVSSAESAAPASSEPSPQLVQEQTNTPEHNIATPPTSSIAATNDITAEQLTASLPQGLLHPVPAPDDWKSETYLAYLNAHKNEYRWFSEIQRETDDEGEYYYTFKDVPFTGTAFTSDKNGQLLRVTEFKDGYKNGNDLNYEVEYKSKISFLESINEYQNGQRHGKRLDFYPDGSAESSRSYVQGASDGDLFQWYEDGTPEMWETFKAGKTNGFRMGFFRSGAIRFYIEFKAGKKHGKERFYFEDGRLEISQDYVDGNCVTPYRLYDAAGQLIDEKSCDPR